MRAGVAAACGASAIETAVVPREEKVIAAGLMAWAR
jgi:hypothetical protein